MLFLKYKIFHQMCSQNAGNVISEPPILKISPGPPLESLSMTPPPIQNQNSTPMLDIDKKGHKIKASPFGDEH